jgi:transcriptional regulator GlxA family with amidase domain
MAKTILVVAFPDAQLLDVAGPAQVFASANECAVEAGLDAPYRVQVVARRSPVVTNSGVTIGAARLPRSADVDTLIVSGGRGTEAAARDRVLVGWLAAQARVARRTASVCTGAFLLGAAGMLDGRRAVTHWRACEALQQACPKARVEVDPIYVQDGPVWTSAGVTSGIDLSLAMVEQDLGHRLSMAVARTLVVFLRRPGGQAQFSEALALQSSDAGFDLLHAWISEHLAGDLSVAALAARAAMSERTFLRRYRAATGSTPAQAVERLRLEAAKRQLAATRTPLKRVAQRCGFGSEETMRQVFQRHLAVAPSEFRERFHASAR